MESIKLLILILSYLIFISVFENGYDRFEAFLTIISLMQTWKLWKLWKTRKQVSRKNESLIDQIKNRFHTAYVDNGVYILFQAAVYWWIQVFLSKVGCNHHNLMAHSHIVSAIGLISMLYQISIWIIKFLGTLMDVSVIKDLSQFRTLLGWVSFHFMFGLYSAVFSVTKWMDLNEAVCLLAAAVVPFFLRCAFVEWFCRMKQGSKQQCWYMLFISGVCLLVTFLTVISNSITGMYIWIKVCRDSYLIMLSIFVDWKSSMKRMASCISVFLHVGYLAYTLFFRGVVHGHISSKSLIVQSPSYAVITTKWAFYLFHWVPLRKADPAVLIYSMCLMLYSDIYSHSAVSRMIIMALKPLLFGRSKLYSSLRSPGKCGLCTKPLQKWTQRLICGHTFHSQCYDEWFSIQFFCPHCIGM